MSHWDEQGYRYQSGGEKDVTKDSHRLIMGVGEHQRERRRKLQQQLDEGIVRT